MKKTFLALLLCVALLLCACQSGSKTPTDTTGKTETDTATPADPGPLFGKWYSKSNQTMLEIAEDLKTATVYNLHIGYTEYYDSKVSGSCTYEDGILTMTSETGKTYSWVFAEKTGTLKSNNGSDSSAYERCDTLPTAYKVIPFPDFAAFNYNTVITLGTYKGLEVDENCARNAALRVFTNYYESNKTKTPATVTDRVAQLGDRVNIDYAGYLDGKKFSGGEAKDQDVSVIADSGYIPGFAEGIAGHEVGSTFDVPVTFPENYHSKDLAGKAVIFKMTLNKIYELTIPDSDIAVWLNGTYSSYDEMLTGYTADEIKQDLWTRVTDAAKVTEMNETMYGYFLSSYRDMYHAYAYYNGIEYENLLAYFGMSDAYFIEQAKLETHGYMTAYAIAAKENLTYNNTDLTKRVEEAIKNLTEKNGYTREEAETYVNENELPIIKAELTVEAVIEYLYSQKAA